MTDIFVSGASLDRQREISEKLKKDGERKAFVITFGCQQNESDSEILRGICLKCGFSPVDKKEDADLILINTCAIREHAELKALSQAGQFKKMKEKNRNLLIGICGCMAEQEGRREAILKSYPYVDFIFGTDKLYMLPEIIFDALAKRKKRTYISSLPHDEFGVIAEGLPVLRDSTFSARVSVMYGCNNFCSYCVVPYVRGRERSRKSEDILKETESLVMSGYKDITFLGQNVNSYKGELSFPELLRKAGSFSGEYFLRFMTSHPKDASSELINVIRDVPNVAKHFHLPAQSGDNRVLKEMNRRYTREKYIEKALEIKAKVPDISLTTDIICGFPTETEEEFLQTLDLIKTVGYDMIFTFLYSPRPNTPAAVMEGQIPHEEKVKRFEALSNLQNGMAEKRNKELVGKTLRVLCDGEKDGLYTGRTSGNKIVNFQGKGKIGEMTWVKITHSAPYALKGVSNEK